MLRFLHLNIATIITLLIIALLVFLAIRSLVKNKKAEIGPCGQKCSECSMAQNCSEINKTKKEASSDKI